MRFYWIFRLNCFSEETEFLFVSDYLYRSGGGFCLVGAVHSSATYPYAYGFTRINQRSAPIKMLFKS